MRFSVVTISYNQAEFLDRAIASVLSQTGVDIEYILVDPGSNDDSRVLIEQYGDRIAHRLFEKDAGPADGLNKGFALATGDVFCYLNSDDTFEPEAFAKVADYFTNNPDVDVVCGHCWITDREDRRIRRMWSGRINTRSIAYGVSDQVQPSTFIRSRAFRKTNGFNVENRSNWDGELVTDLICSGAKIRILEEFLSTYRLHGSSITNSGKLMTLIQAYYEGRFHRLMGRQWRQGDGLIKLLLKSKEFFFRPEAFWERVIKGPIFNRGVE